MSKCTYGDDVEVLIKRLHANGPRVVKDGCGGLYQGAKGPEDRLWVVGTIGDIDE